jgi:hypothetical protein
MRSNALEEIGKELKIKRKTWREDSVSPALLKNYCVVLKKTGWIQNAAQWNEIVSLQVNFSCPHNMLDHSAAGPVEFRFILSTIGTHAAPHSSHFVSSRASRQLINPEPRSFSKLVWALWIVPFSVTKCLPVTRYELGTPSRINSKKLRN